MHRNACMGVTPRLHCSFSFIVAFKKVKVHFNWNGPSWVTVCFIALFNYTSVQVSCVFFDGCSCSKLPVPAHVSLIEFHDCLFKISNLSTSSLLFFVCLWFCFCLFMPQKHLRACVCRTFPSNSCSWNISSTSQGLTTPHTLFVSLFTVYVICFCPVTRRDAPLVKHGCESTMYGHSFLGLKASQIEVH